MRKYPIDSRGELNVGRSPTLRGKENQYAHRNATAIAAMATPRSPTPVATAGVGSVRIVRAGGPVGVPLAPCAARQAKGKPALPAWGRASSAAV